MSETCFFCADTGNTKPDVIVKIKDTIRKRAVKETFLFIFIETLDDDIAFKCYYLFDLGLSIIQRSVVLTPYNDVK